MHEDFQLAIVVKTIPLPNMPLDIDTRAYPFKVVDCLHHLQDGEYALKLTPRHQCASVGFCGNIFQVAPVLASSSSLQSTTTLIGIRGPSESRFRKNLSQH